MAVASMHALDHRRPYKAFDRVTASAIKGDNANNVIKLATTQSMWHPPQKRTYFDYGLAMM